MRFTKTAWIIVDAYSTGKNLAPAVKSKGYTCIHIKSSEQLPAKYQHQETDFDLSLTYTGDIETLLEKLKPFQIKCCIPGYELGVELADLLAEKLNLPCNGSKLSSARRDKFIMTETVADAGLKTVKHFKSDNIAAIIEWAKDLSFNQPIVLKPLDSANGDGVHFCHTEQELQQGCQTILASNNQFGKQNTYVLAQSYNPGQEYIINTVSWNEEHYVAEIWRITRKPFSTIYDKAEIVHDNEEEWIPIVKYTFQVLGALKIAYGAATTELKYTKENGPVLLETSSRLMSGAPLAFSQELTGFTQCSLMIEAYTNPNDFLVRIRQKRPVLQRYGIGVILISDCEGRLQSAIDTSLLHALPSLHTYIIDGEAGNTLRKTVNSLTSPGEIYLIANDKETLEKDYQKIRKLEQNGLYRNAMQKNLSSIHSTDTAAPCQTSSLFKTPSYSSI